jgi:hypothetical protein
MAIHLASLLLNKKHFQLKKAACSQAAFFI